MSNDETDLDIKYRLNEDFRVPYYQILADHDYEEDMSDWQRDRG